MSVRPLALRAPPRACRRLRGGAPRPLRHLGGRRRLHPLRPPGGGAARGLRRQARDPQHADRLRQVDGRARDALQGARRRSDLLLHQPDQGARLGEVLRPVRRLRRRQRRHADRRRLDQPARQDPLLHFGGPRQHGAAVGRPARRALRRARRVSLLLRRRARLGLAGAAHHAHEDALPPHVGDPG